MTASRKFFSIFLFIAGCFLLISCSDNDRSSSTQTPDPGGPPNEPVGNASLTIKVDNLQGAFIVDWHGEQFTLDESTPIGEFSSTKNETAEVNIAPPPFQTCEILSEQTIELEQTVEVFCNTPFTHYLDVNIVNLKGELSISWGSDTEYSFIENQPSLSISSNSANIVQPEIITQPNLQSCTGEFVEEESINAKFNIECSDAESNHLVEITSDIPFPLYLRGTENVAEVVDNSPVTMVGSQIDGITVDGTRGTQFCELDKKAFSEVISRQRWQLQCNEYVVHVSPGIGVVLTFDNQEQHILEPGDFPEAELFPVSRYSKQIILSKEFGAKEVLIQEGVPIWRDIDTLPNDGELHAYVNTYSSSYLLFKSTETNEFSLYQLEDKFEQAKPVVIFNDEDDQDKTIYDSELVVVSYLENEIAYTEITEVGENKERRIIGIENGAPVRQFYTRFNNNNGFQIAGSNSLDAPFIFQVNDTNPLRPLETSMDMYLLGQTSSDPLVDNLDTQLKVVNWPDEQGNQRIWAMGKNLIQNRDDTHLVELDVIQVGSGPRQIIWREITSNSSIDYDSMGTDGKLFVINGQSDALGHQLVSMFNEFGPVNLQTLAESTGLSAILRTQVVETPVLFTDAEATISRKEISPVNGWVLMFSGDDNNAGEMWVSNGEEQKTRRILENVSWEDFNNYRLLFAGSGLIVLKGNGGETSVLQLQ